MLRIKVGIRTAALRLPFRQALHTAAQLGAEGVEIDARHEFRPAEMTRTAVRDVRKLLDDRRLRVTAVRFRTRRGYDTPDDLERRVEATRQAMTFAWNLGAAVVVNHVGRLPETPAGPAWELLLAVLSDLGRHGQRVGATLAAETGADDPQRLGALLAALPPGSLGIDLNPGALEANGHSSSQAVQTLGPHVLHVHARDGTRDAAQGRGLATPLGRGSVDWPAIFAALEERDYRGFFTVEPTDSADPVNEAKQAVQFLKSF